MERLNWGYNSIALYSQALTHTSYAHENNGDVLHNERLEFLGDAVLELIVSDYLYNFYGNLPEGELTRLRADLVCESSLSRLALWFNIGEFLLLGKGEKAHGGASRPSILADVVEALIGALYLDVGYMRCYQYVTALYEPIFKILDEGGLRRDYKTLVQERLQYKHGVTPVYVIAKESGPDHEKTFFSQLFMNEKIIGKGKGRSKKEAEQAAARAAWENVLNDDINTQPQKNS